MTSRKSPLLCVATLALLTACKPAPSGNAPRTPQDREAKPPQSEAAKPLSNALQRQDTAATPRAETSAAIKEVARQNRILGEKGAVTMTDLPEGNFKNELAALSHASRENALANLAKYHVPVLDLDSLHAAKDGMLYYTCKMLPDVTSGYGTSHVARKADSTDYVPISNPPIRHSREGAPNAIYLDFNGGVVSGTAWLNGARRDCLPIDSDGDRTTFSPEEQAYIIEVWERVAEDYAPFDIDVTTEEPASYASNRIAHAMITKTLDANGLENPHYGAGGIAFLGGFNSTNYAALYSPVFVSFTNTGDVETAYAASGVSHEVGHNFGLEHDGNSQKQYYTGHANGSIYWGPIMGACSTWITQWSKGDYYDASNTEDDIAIIAKETAYAPDDVANTAADAEEIPCVNGSSYATGLINSPDDVDVFKVTITHPYSNITVSPMCVDGKARGANGDLKYELRTADGTVIESSAPKASVKAQTPDVSIAPGEYYLYVSNDSCGDPYAATPSGYTNYGCLGNYFVRITPGAGMPLTFMPYLHSTASLTCKPSGTGPWTYEWKKNNRTLECTGSTLELKDLSGWDKGVYTVTATDANGGLTTGRTFLMPVPKNTQMANWGSNANNTLDHADLQISTIVYESICQLYGMALMQDGTVSLWGDYASHIGEPPETLTDVVDIFATDYRAMALKSDGTLVIWGQNDYHECDAPELDDPIAIAGGLNHSMALEASGEVVTWGSLNYDIYTPPSDLGVVSAIDAGAYYSLALSADGHVTAWGNNSYGQTNAPEGNNFTAISAGSYLAGALKDDGSIVTWGAGKAPPASSGFAGLEVPKSYRTDDGCYGIYPDGTLETTAHTGLTSLIKGELVSFCASGWCSALSTEYHVHTLFMGEWELGGKWSNAWEWIDDTYYPWIYSYTYDMWIYIYDDGTLTWTDSYWLAYIGDGYYGWGYAYPMGGWYCMTEDNVWHWLKTGEPIPR